MRSKRYAWLWLIISLVIVSINVVQAVEPKWFTVPISDKEPDLAASLSDPVWDKALKIPFSKFNSAPGNTAKNLTESYWLYANGTLFVAFKCFNPDSPNLFATPNQTRDQCIYRGESVELFVGDFAGDLYYQLVVDATGNIFDGERAACGWNGEWKCRVFRDVGFWTVVLEVPAPVLSAIWHKGTFITLDVARHAFNADGSGEEITTLSPPGFHSPEDRLFLGLSNPEFLGEKLSQSIKQCKSKFAKSIFISTFTQKLASLEAFVAECKTAGDVSLERYQELFRHYVQTKRTLEELKSDLILDTIFSNGD